MLENKAYIRFSLAHAVEVICMEEIDRAVSEKADTIATYKARDAYGDEVEYLKEFPGLTLDELKGLSSTDAVLRFMEGGKIPYTAIVDPHSGKAMEAIEGKPSVKSLTAAIGRARAKLEKEHGKPSRNPSPWEPFPRMARISDLGAVAFGDSCAPRMAHDSNRKRTIGRECATRWRAWRAQR